MSEPKTKATTQNVTKFLNTVEPVQKREDSFTLVEIFQKATAEKAVMWGPSIVGFGSYQTKSGDWPLIAFSPRKQNLTLYVMASSNEIAGFLDKLGKHKVSGGCLHINKLADVDQNQLSKLIEKAFALAKKIHT